MHMRATFGLAGCLAVFFIAVPASASTNSWNDLSAQQVAALDASQQRLGEFDRALQILDRRHARGQLSRQDYQMQQHELVGFIANEADFQNAILHKDSAEAFVLSSEQTENLKNACGAVLAVLARVGLQALTAIHP
jgi:hypothetical protein